MSLHKAGAGLAHDQEGRTHGAGIKATTIHAGVNGSLEVRMMSRPE